MRGRFRAGSVKSRGRKPAAPKRPGRTGTARPRNSTAGVTRLERDLNESLEQQTATADVLRVIASSAGDLQAVLDMLVESATRLCEAERAVIFLPKERGYQVAASYGHTEQSKQYWGDAPIKADRGSVAGRVLLEGKTIHIPNAAKDAEYKMGSGRRTLLGVPLLRQGTAFGVFVLARSVVKPFNDKQIGLVATFANQAVIAIENARLLSELRDSLDRQTATADILRVIAGTPEDSKRALDTIAETASRMFDTANVNFRRLEGNVLRIVSSAGPSVSKLREVLPDIPLEPTDPAVRSVLDNRQIAVEDRLSMLPNERGEISRALHDLALGGLPIRSQVFTPLLREGKAIGVMIVSRSEVRPFQAHELELMKGFADQAVIAIENARLLSELRERTAEVVKLNQQLEQRVADQVGEIERMRRLRRFLPPQVADLIVASGTEKQLESHRREITALFCDLRGFTGFSESSDPEDVMALLRDYHAAIGQIVIKYRARSNATLATA